MSLWILDGTWNPFSLGDIVELLLISGECTNPVGICGNPSGR